MVHDSTDGCLREEIGIISEGHDADLRCKWTEKRWIADPWWPILSTPSIHIIAAKAVDENKTVKMVSVPQRLHSSVQRSYSTAGSLGFRSSKTSIVYEGRAWKGL